ncbi:MAG: ATP-binding cassette domain-containing protein [Bacteroidia bacterium]|nr:ATP-binding cassette domain-containing protein [Bacteroidota bacterium]MBP6640786.1 ATP-binding cassette domain-containing protein [Bacteroidia bacterium]MBP8074055.1 ATP-binding cassette domain-containing protein [Bacteroidia bacterium]
MNDSYSEKILEFKDVSSGYSERTVLQNVNFSILKGEFVYMIGRTGAGKSSILKMIYADLLPAKGQLTVGDYNITKLKNREIPFLRRKIGIVFQDFQLLPDRDIYENIRFAMRATGWTDKTKINNRINELLAKVGLSAKLHSRPHQLSGGEQQRVSIARALINDPLLLLADEPTGNLDPEATDMIMEILFRINLAGTSVIMATHEHDLIRRYPARTLECRDGSVFDHKMNFQ